MIQITELMLQVSWKVRLIKMTGISGVASDVSMIYAQETSSGDSSLLLNVWPFGAVILPAVPFSHCNALRISPGKEAGLHTIH